jgi:hypothetical protein
LGLRFTFEVLQVDEQRGREHEGALVQRQLGWLERDAEAVTIGEAFTQQAAPLLLDTGELGSLALEREGPRSPNRRRDGENHLLRAVDHIEAFGEQRKALLQRPERTAVGSAHLQALKEKAKRVQGAEDELTHLVEKVNLEGTPVSHEHAREEGEPTFPLLRREPHLSAVRFDRVLVPRLEAEQLGDLAPLHDHDLVRLLNDREELRHDGEDPTRNQRAKVPRWPEAPELSTLRLFMGSARFGLLACWMLTACAGPQVQPTKHYTGEMLTGKRVVFVPLAVSDPLGDERTGIMLSDTTRSVASAGACQELSQSWDDGTLLCVREESGKRAPELVEMERLFAGDKPIPRSAMTALREKSKARYALLFRPESVSSSHEVSRELDFHTTPLYAGAGVPVLGTTMIVAAMVGADTAHHKTVSDTELSYTLSASLVDLDTGTLLKVGVFSGSASRTEERSLGFAETPPAAPILQKIMIALGDEVLDE